MALRVLLCSWNLKARDMEFKAVSKGDRMT